MNYPERDLHGPNQAKAIIDLIQSIFISELLRPSKIYGYTTHGSQILKS